MKAMNTTKIPVWLAFAMTGFLAAAASGCATHAVKPDTGNVVDAHALAELSDSSVDISYVIGHSHRRFVAWAKHDSFGGQTLFDHQILRESGIDRHHYSEFLNRVEQFVSTPLRKPADLGAAAAVAGAPAATPSQSDDSCRTPFTVTLRIGTDTKTLQGCRGADEGALSHLVRDGEFLLYSNK